MSPPLRAGPLESACADGPYIGYACPPNRISSNVPAAKKNPLELVRRAMLAQCNDHFSNSSNKLKAKANLLSDGAGRRPRAGQENRAAFTLMGSLRAAAAATATTSYLDPGPQGDPHQTQDHEQSLCQTQGFRDILLNISACEARPSNVRFISQSCPPKRLDVECTARPIASAAPLAAQHCHDVGCMTCRDVGCSANLGSYAAGDAHPIPNIDSDPSNMACETSRDFSCSTFLDGEAAGDVQPCPEVALAHLKSIHCCSRASPDRNSECGIKLLSSSKSPILSGDVLASPEEVDVRLVADSCGKSTSDAPDQFGTAFQSNDLHALVPNTSTVSHVEAAPEAHKDEHDPWISPILETRLHFT